MLIDIVLLPPKSLGDKIGKQIKEAVKGVSYFYIVDNIKLTPHISLFHFRASKNKLKLIIREVAEIAKNYKLVSIKSIASESYRKDHRIISLKLEKTGMLKTLNRKVVKECNFLRDGELFFWYKDKKKIKELSELDKKYIKKYGTYWSVERNFNPHITLVRLKDVGDSLSVLKKMKKFKFNFPANTMAICEINKFGQVVKILKKFRLK